MHKSHLLGAVCTSVFVLFLSATNAAATQPLEARLGGLAYYDPNLNITWLANANAGAGSIFDDGFSTTDGTMSWSNANDWAESLTVVGVSDWRLASADVNGDGTVIRCTGGGVLGCEDNEMGYLVWEEGITRATPGPFTFISLTQPNYWSGTELNATQAWGQAFAFSLDRILTNKTGGQSAWAVHDGDVGPSVVGVDVDIKPGSDPNSINLGSGGTTPVAILGSASLDVNDINPDTLTLGTAGIKTVGKTDRTLCSVADVSGDFTAGPEGTPDGFPDLVCHFITMDIVPEAGDTTATISGELNDGTAIEGQDSVNIVP